MADAAAAGATEQPPVRRIAAAGAVGNILEWFDFAVYGFMAPFIADQFFPSDDPLTSLLAVYGTFAAGYIARPVGAVIFGHLGDTRGRHFVLMASILMMGAGTAAIGLLPTYSQIGESAAFLLIALRIVQGMSVGGEYTGSAVFVAEHAPRRQRATITSFVAVGSITGFLLGSALAAGLTNLFTDAQMKDFVWRLPFLTGLLIMAAGIALRRSLEDSADAPAGHDLQGSPVIVALRHHWPKVLRVAGLALGANVGFYIMFVFAVSYLSKHVHVATAKMMDINTVALVVVAVMPLIGAHVSDRIGRKPALMISALALLLFSYPLFWLMNHPDVTMILLGQLGFAVICGWVFGINPVAMVESLPREIRVSGLAIGYNIPLALCAGTAPAVSAYLIERTADDFSPVYYLMGMAALSLCAVLTLRETRDVDLH